MIPAFVDIRGSANNKTLGTTLAVVVNATVTAGNLLHAVVLFDNAGTTLKPIVSSITKPAGETNNWVSLGRAQSTSTSIGAFASAEMLCIQTTVNWPASSSYTVTLDTSVTMKSVQLYEYSGVQAVQRCTAGTAYSTTTTAASATTTGTTPQVNDLVLGYIFGSNVAASQAGDTDTTGGAWSGASGYGTTGSSGATNNYGIQQDKVLTSGVHQTLNNSAAMTAGNGAIVAILQSIPAATFTQAAYRWYADGTETGSTALASQDTGYTADTSGGDVNLALRVRLQSTNTGDQAATDDWQLQWEKNTSGTWNNVAVPGGLVDSYPDTNTGFATRLFATQVAAAQSFTATAGNLSRAGFYLSKAGTPNGTFKACLWAHSGTFGTNGAPATAPASPVATSTTITDVSALSTGAAWFYFDFDGSYTLTAGTKYCIGVVATNTGATSADAVSVNGDSTSPTHAGNASSYGAFWAGSSAEDLIFEVYTAASTTAIAYDSANLTDAAATTNRLGAGSGSFVAGEISETGLVTDLGWTANNYTELLYSLTLKQADLTASDTLAFRVLRNAATTGMTYTAVPAITIGGGGSATASPAVIARSVAIPAATPQASTTTSPALIARSALMPAATGSANALPSPALIARSVTVDAPTPQAGSTTAPALIARTVTLPAPTTTAQTNGTATPAVIACTVTMPAPTTTGGLGASATPAVIARTAAMSAPTPQASSTTSPALIARTVAVPSTTTTAGTAGTAAPAVIARSAAMPAPTPQAGSTGVPVTIARTAAIPATTTTAGLGATAAPALIARTVAMPAPTTSAGAGSTATPAAIACVVAMPAPTPQAGSTLTPATIARAATLGLVSATGASAGTTTPAVIARSVAVPAPTPLASSVTSPAVIARVVVMPAPIAQAGTVRSVAVIARVVAMPAPTASGTSTALATPATIARLLTMPAPTTSGGLGATATPAVIARLVALPSATPNAGTVVLVAVIARLVVIHQAAATAGAAAYQLYYGANQVVALYYGTIPIAGNKAHLG